MSMNMTSKRPFKRFHFVFGLRPQTEPFHISHYLCLASCIAVNQPDEIHLHLRHEPYGPWWDAIKHRVTLRQIDEASAAGFDESRYAHSAEGRMISKYGWSYAHESDFVRLAILEREGGVYADMDTLFVAPYPDQLYQQDCVIGEEDAQYASGGVIVPSLCNAVMFARAQSPFIQQLRAQTAEVFDGTWSKHSCQLLTRLWSQMPAQLGVAPRTWFFHFGVSRHGIRALLEENMHPPAAVPAQLMSIHLWAHLWWSEKRQDFTLFHAGLMDEAYVRRAASTYARLAKPFLPEVQV